MLMFLNKILWKHTFSVNLHAILDVVSSSIMIIYHFSSVMEIQKIPPVFMWK